ncbi:MAG: class I SAM-dependent methyltransferase [Candidatus Saganbacteria bacterium]|nr:class I SAM-dependent methyltransferase [Candidatus Saganbacteria bacterium]
MLIRETVLPKLIRRPYFEQCQKYRVRPLDIRLPEEPQGKLSRQDSIATTQAALAELFHLEPDKLIDRALANDLAKYSEQFHLDLTDPRLVEQLRSGEAPLAFALFISSGFAVAARQFQHLYKEILQVICLDIVDYPQELLEFDPPMDTTEVVPGVIEAIPFKSGHFSFVFARPSLINLEDPVRAINEVKRVLAPGGTMFMQFLNIEGSNVNGLSRRSWNLLKQLAFYRRFYAPLFSRFDIILQGNHGLVLRITRRSGLSTPDIRGEI